MISAQLRSTICLQQRRRLRNRLFGRTAARPARSEAHLLEGFGGGKTFRRRTGAADCVGACQTLETAARESRLLSGLVLVESNTATLANKPGRLAQL